MATNLWTTLNAIEKALWLSLIESGAQNCDGKVFVDSPTNKSKVKIVDIELMVVCANVGNIIVVNL